MKKPKPRKNRAYRRNAYFAALFKGVLRKTLSEPSIVRRMLSITQVTEVDAKFPGSYTYVS